MEPIRSWTLVRSGHSIIDWVPTSELELHGLGRKCECDPEKVLNMEGPHVIGASFRHRDLTRRQ